MPTVFRSSGSLGSRDTQRLPHVFLGPGLALQARSRSLCCQWGLDAPVLPPDQSILCSPFHVPWLLKQSITDWTAHSNKNTKTIILSWFWRPEVQDQGVGRAMLPAGALGEDPSWPLPASGGPRYPWLVAPSPQSSLQSPCGLLP